MSAAGAARQPRLFDPQPEPPLVVGDFRVHFIDALDECIVLEPDAENITAPCVTTCGEHGDEESQRLYRFMQALREQMRRPQQVVK